jgi:hypothetical protein
MQIRRGYAPAQRFFDPLAAPAEADLIDLVAFAEPETPWPGQIKHLRRPTVVLVGDDPGGPFGLGGPEAWQCTSKLSRWLRAVIIHGAGGEPEHYAAAVRAARKVGRAALIETTSAHALKWRARLDCPRTLMILPSVGAHPVTREPVA